MSDNFLSAEKPKSETDSGWIEYALLLGWEELPVGYEYVTDNATAELATLRAQLAEARDIVIVLAYTNEMLSPEESREFVSVDMRVSVIRSARAWYNKVTTA